MFSRKEFKSKAKLQLKEKWTNPVLVTFIFFLISGFCGAIPLLGMIISLVITGPFTLGMAMYFFCFTADNQNDDINLLFRGFNRSGQTIGLYFLYMLWVFLWMLLLFVPGIIKSVSYSQCWFIMAENENISPDTAIKLSMKITAGYKWKIFVMMLSFLGWVLLCIPTLFIGLLWLSPYMYSSFANLYRFLKEQAVNSGICSLQDFEGPYSADPS